MKRKIGQSAPDGATMRPGTMRSAAGEALARGRCMLQRRQTSRPPRRRCCCDGRGESLCLAVAACNTRGVVAGACGRLIGDDGSPIGQCARFACPRLQLPAVLLPCRQEGSCARTSVSSRSHVRIIQVPHFSANPLRRCIHPNCPLLHPPWSPGSSPPCSCCPCAPSAPLLTSR